MTPEEQKDELKKYTEELEKKMNSLSEEEKEKLDEHAEMLFRKLPLRIKAKIMFAMVLTDPTYRKVFIWLDVAILLALVYWITGIITRYFIAL
jgi:hypothetical protein